jgi:hypothetical protein
MNIKITKASGVIEDIKPEKLRASLIRSGADDLQADEVIGYYSSGLFPITRIVSSGFISSVSPIGSLICVPLIP